MHPVQVSADQLPNILAARAEPTLPDRASTKSFRLSGKEMFIVLIAPVC